MKNKMFLLISLMIFTFHGICLANAPHQIAGFVLGRSIEDYKDKVRMETALPIRYQWFLQEVEIKHLNEFKSGRVWFINRTSSQRIVRVKLKYADSSKAFYKSLLKRFIEQIGQPLIKVKKRRRYIYENYLLMWCWKAPAINLWSLKKCLT